MRIKTSWWLDDVDTSDQLEGDTKMQINKHLRGAYAMALRLAWTAATDADARSSDEATLCGGSSLESAPQWGSDEEARARARSEGRS